MKMILRQNRTIMESNRVMLNSASFDMKVEEIDTYLNSTVIQGEKMLGNRSRALGSNLASK